MEPRPNSDASSPASRREACAVVQGRMREAIQGRVCGRVVHALRSVISCPTGAPSTCRLPPYLHCTNTPNVYCLPATVTSREEVPMPPLNPLQTMPVPPPTAP